MRVSLICFDRNLKEKVQLNGIDVGRILSDLKADPGFDLADAVRLRSNRRVAFEGPKKYGAFDIDGDIARSLLLAGGNPNGKPNSNVIRPWLNGRSFSQEFEDKWIIDFTRDQDADEAALYECPFQHVILHVQPTRARDRNEGVRERYWLFERTRPALRHALETLPRFIATVRHSRHRLFRFLPAIVVPDTALIAIARDDDTSFGILHSRFHELWSLRMGTFLGVGNDPRYTPSTTFETFPFPEGLTPDIPAAAYLDDPRARAIAVAAARLNELRENWLNPADLVVRVAEVVPGYPDRILPVDDAAAKELKKRTLTNLYNQRPHWLANAHAALDLAVADAYGWGDDWRAGMATPGATQGLADDDILARLFALNQARG